MTSINLTSTLTSFSFLQIYTDLENFGKLQGVSKGSTVDKLLRSLVNIGKTPDFVMCIGDDRSDEDMFESIDSITSSAKLFPAAPQVFSCTVGQKPSKAKYYVNDISGVIRLLQSIAAISTEENKLGYNCRAFFEETA